MSASTRHYDTILSPLSSNKKEIAEAVEELFKVTVTAVNTIKVHGKTKRFKGIAGKRIDRKKAIVTLKDGDSIDVTTGLK
jgi:large subunit ribosomal protein L23